jgi:hypothetical protein
MTGLNIAKLLEFANRVMFADLRAKRGGKNPIDESEAELK